LKLYLDTSALVKLYVEEEGSATVREAIARAGTVATTVIAYVEAYAAFARRRREGRLSRGDYRRTIQDLQSDWDHYLLLEVTSELIRRAADLAAMYPLRAYDAMHLASAKVLQERLQGPIFFACWDSNLSAGAKREGLSLVPAR
jgi:predicted nucleic acid-binding protein